MNLINRFSRNPAPKTDSGFVFCCGEIIRKGLRVLPELVRKAQ